MRPIEKQQNVFISVLRMSLFNECTECTLNLESIWMVFVLVLYYLGFGFAIRSSSCNCFCRRTLTSLSRCFSRLSERFCRYNDRWLNTNQNL